MMVDVPPEFPRSGPLVGRSGDLTRLARMIGLDPTGPRSAGVLLGGDAGVGKTRLLAELAGRATAAGWQVLIGHCLNFGDSALPYLPFTEVFGTLAARSPEQAESVLGVHPALARLMPGRRLLSDGHRTPDPAGSDRIERAELFEAVLAALADLSRASPVLLVVEDLHWADHSTREMLGLLLARPSAGPVSIIGSYRADDLHRRHPLRAVAGEWARLPGVQRVSVQPLSAADIRALIAGFHPTPLPAADVRRIIERAEGNAFFTEELVAAVESSDRTLPDGLADLLLVRLDQFADPARQVIRAASVAGRQVSHALLARVLGLDDGALDSALREAMEGNVLVQRGSDGYAFRHALLAEAGYDDLLPGERVRLHAAYAAALTSGAVAGTAAELARHARAAHDIPTALRASVQAGDEAMAVAGPAEAERHYEVALELLPAAGERAVEECLDETALIVRASAAAAAAGDVFRAIALVSDHLQRLPLDTPSAKRATVLHALAGVALLADTGMDVLDLTTELLRIVPVEPASAMRASAASLHARANADRYRDDAAARWAGEALSLADRLGLPEVTADAATTLGRLSERAGEPETSRRRLTEAVAAARASGEVAAELRSLFNIGSLHFEVGELAEARAGYEAAAARAEQAGRPWAPYGVDARVMRGVVAYISGCWEDVTEIVDVTAEAPPLLATAGLGAVGLMVSAGRGEREGLDRLAQVRPMWERDGMIAVISAGAAIDLHGDIGDLDAATAVHDDVVNCVSTLWHKPLFEARVRLSALLLGQLGAQAVRSASRDLAELAGRGHELAEVAVAAAAAGLSARRRRPGPESDAWLARVVAEHARLRWLAGVDPPGEEELIDRWRSSVAAFDSFGHVFEAARSRARLAAALRAAGRPVDAESVAAQARTVASRLGAGPLAAELRSLGPVNRTLTPKGGQPLTPRELEVLTLVAQGRSNRDIGRQLFISGKTVSVHVSAILAKLGASGRTEAVALANRRGDLPGEPLG